MKKNYFLTLFALCLTVITVACNNDKQPVMLTYEEFERDVDAKDPEGAPAYLSLVVSVPTQGDFLDNVSVGIKEIMKASEVEERLRIPLDGSVKDAAEQLAGGFQEAISKAEPSGPLQHTLHVKYLNQNDLAVFFEVADGIYGNGAPSSYYRIVRKADGHVMENQEVIKISKEDIATLVGKYAKDVDMDNLNLGEDAFFYPTPSGCRMLYQPQFRFYDTLDLPMSEIEKFLTEEGKKLFKINSNTKSGKVAVSQHKPGRGELGVYDLRGPVKECKQTNDGFTVTYTFDKNGFWLTQDGQPLKVLFPGGIERDKNKRIVSGSADGYGSCNIEYNAQGLATVIAYDDVYRELSYDADGYVSKEKMEIAPEMGDDNSDGETHNYSYTIVKKDNYGNWTSRKDQKGKLTTRIITYYK